jgi:hypothetical protein
MFTLSIATQSASSAIVPPYAAPIQNSTQRARPGKSNRRYGLYVLVPQGSINLTSYLVM